MYIYTYIYRRVRLQCAQLNHDLIVAMGLWDSASLGRPDMYIDPRVRIKSAQLDHDLIVGLWVARNTRYVHIHLHVYIYIYILGHGYNPHNHITI